MPMTLAELTEKMHTFVRAKGWYEPDSPKPQSLRSLAISLSLESAEVLEHFQWQDITPGDMDEQTRQALGAELADVALYLLQLSSLAGIDLEQAVLDKLNVNYGRMWT
jgi:NTP pyrophosphatase (non-canonical NTP hydrolase)